MSRTIAAVTGSRAEFGLLRPVLDLIIADPELELKLYATGMHICGVLCSLTLAIRIRRTLDEITSEGYQIEKPVDIFLQDDTPKGVARSTALSMMGFADIFAIDKPDLVLVLGDRFEIFGAVSAACIHGIPVAHIHGGELTEGVLDDQFRHSITKMSHLHFAASKEYKERIIQMGEQPERVFNCGSPSVDAVFNSDFMTKDELEEDLGIKFA